jgi:hypothetical protein
LPLFELANKTSIIDKDRLNTNFYSFFKQNFLENWKQQVTYKQRLGADFYRILSEYKVFDEDIWNKLIKTTLDFGRIQNLENYDIMLRGLMWYNTNPESPKFGKLNKQIETFKAQITKNENRSWKYDVEVNCQ